MIGGAIFLVLEMDRLVQGVLQISSWPIRNAFGADELVAAGPLPFREI